MLLSSSLSGRKRLPETSVETLETSRQFPASAAGEAGVARGLLHRAMRHEANIRRLRSRLHEETRQRNEVMHEAQRRFALVQQEAVSQELGKFPYILYI